MANWRYPDRARPPRAGDQAPEADGFETLTARTYRDLRERIVVGQLRPGQRLIRRELSQQLGVSPVPITEALFMLEHDGLVEKAPMYGARVVLLTLERVQSDHILREAIECQAARRCAERCDKAAIKRLRALAIPLDKAMLEADPKDRVGMRQHVEFHLAVAQASGAASLVQQLTRLWYGRQMQLSWVNAGLKTVPKHWHEQLVRAIAGGDGDAADAAMRRHIRFGSESLIEALKQMPGTLVNSLE